MPIIAVQVHTLDTPKRMQDNLRITLHKAGIPEYSWKQQRAGFEVWHAEQNEGETRIIWHTFTKGDAAQAVEQQVGLEQCAAILQEHYWVKLDIPKPLRYVQANQPTLRVLLRLSWLG
jgi:hypothetical protein